MNTYRITTSRAALLNCEPHGIFLHLLMAEEDFLYFNPEERINNNAIHKAISHSHSTKVLSGH